MNRKIINNNVETYGGIIFGAILIFLLFLFPEITPKEIGSYPVQRQANGDMVPMNRTIYKISPFLQTIIYWIPGINETPKKLVECVVRDKKNWIGYYPDGSGTVEMRKGKLISKDPNEIYVGRYRWWLMQYEIL